MGIHVGILIFDDVEVLDFAGPYEPWRRASSRRCLAQAV